MRQVDLDVRAHRAWGTGLHSMASAASSAGPETDLEDRARVFLSASVRLSGDVGFHIQVLNLSFNF